MTVEDTIRVTAVSGEWSEVKQRNDSSMTDKGFELLPENPNQGDAHYAIADAEGNIQGAVPVSQKSPMKQPEKVATGQKLFIRGNGVTASFTCKVGTI